MPQDPSLPRWLDRNALATYISLRVDEIPRFVRAGKIPQPSYQLGPKSPWWWSAAVDEAFGMAPTPGLEIEEAAAKLVAKILAGAPRKRR